MQMAHETVRPTAQNDSTRALAAPDANANQTFHLADIEATSNLPSVLAKSAALNMKLVILIK
jgi:hypothetical protein